MEYCIVSTSGTGAQRLLEQEVFALMQKGWTPQGGIFCMASTDSPTRMLEYKQAMIRTQPLTQRISVSVSARGWEDVTLQPFYDGVDP